MLGTLFAILHFASALPALADQLTCAVLRNPNDKTNWTYCEEPRVNSKTGPCAGIPMADGEFCVMIGAPNQPLLPLQAMSRHNVEMVYGETSLAKILRMHPGQKTPLTPPDDPETHLIFERAIRPSPDLIPQPPKEVEANARLHSARAARLPTVSNPDWLSGIPDSVQPLLKAWLVEKAGRHGETNLSLLTAKVRSPGCRRYMNYAVEKFEEAGLPKLSALSLIAESECKVDAESNEHAVGVCQFMRDTALGYHLRVDPGHDDRLNPMKCIPAAAEYSRDNLDALNTHGCAGSRVIKSLMAYNAGLPHLMRRHVCVASDQAVFGWRGETGDYVKRILGMAYVLDTNPALAKAIVAEPEAAVRDQPAGP